VYASRQVLVKRMVNDPSKWSWSGHVTYVKFWEPSKLVSAWAPPLQ